MLPNSELTWSDVNGLAPALGSQSWNGTGWTNNTLAEAISGIDPVSGDAEIGCFLYLGSDNLPRNYGDLFWFEPFPGSNQQVKVPTGEVDFYGVLLHEIFHCLGFWGSSEEWISRVETRELFHYFHLRYEGRLSFTEEGQKKFSAQERLIPVKEFYLLSVGHMFTESKKYADLHHAGIVLKGVDFVWPRITDCDKRGELKYEIFRATP